LDMYKSVRVSELRNLGVKDSIYRSDRHENGDLSVYSKVEAAWIVLSWVG